MAQSVSNLWFDSNIQFDLEDKNYRRRVGHVTGTGQNDDLKNIKSMVSNNRIVFQCYNRLFLVQESREQFQDDHLHFKLVENTCTLICT